MTPAINEFGKRTPSKPAWVLGLSLPDLLIPCLAALLPLGACSSSWAMFPITGALIAGATVTIHNEGTGTDIVVKTTGAGDYTAPYLKPGTYTVTAGMAGFKELARLTSPWRWIRRPR